MNLIKAGRSVAIGPQVLALVPVELFLQVGLGVRDSAKCAQRGRELFATCGAGSDAGHRPQMLNNPDSALSHESLLPSSA